MFRRQAPYGIWDQRQPLLADTTSPGLSRTQKHQAQGPRWQLSETQAFLIPLDREGRSQRPERARRQLASMGLTPGLGHFRCPIFIPTPTLPGNSPFLPLQRSPRVGQRQEG